MARRKIKKTEGIFAAHIRELRKTLGKTRVEMAQMVGVSERAYAYWESGRHAPPATKLEKLSSIAEKEGADRLQWARLFHQGREGTTDPGRIEAAAQKLPSDLSRALLKITVAAELLTKRSLGGSASAKAKLLDLAARATRMAGDESSSY